MLGANNYSGTDLQRIQAQKLLRGSVEVKGNGKLSAELMIALAISLSRAAISECTLAADLFKIARALTISIGIFCPAILKLLIDL